jgi:hypothetical protein
MQSPKRQNLLLVRVGVRTGTFNAAEPKSLPKYDLKK